MVNKMISDLHVTRNFSAADMHSEEQSGTITGHAAVFGQKADIGRYFYEIIERGAFDECDFTDVLFYINHDMDKIPLARSRRNNGNSTMQIAVDDEGLRIDAKLDIENNQEARSLNSAISRGDIDGMSFCFKIKEQIWENLDTEMPTRRITKMAKVYEVSAVNVPAYGGTSIYARDKKALDNAEFALENARSKEPEGSESRQLAVLKLKTAILAKG